MTTIICTIALLGLAVGALWGLHQGQVMVKPKDAMHRQDWYGETTALSQFDLGPRGHRWFVWYHLINAGFALALAVLSILLWEQGSLLLVALAGAFSWLAAEPAESYVRYRRFDNNGEPEHVTFADLRLVVPWYGAHDVGNGVIQHDGWYWRQILPFHAPVWIMTLIRLAIVCVLMGVAL